MSAAAIRVDGLSKEYLIGARDKGYGTFREALADGFAAPFRRLGAMGREPPPEERFWALKGVSFEVKRGEVVGVIGRNGAGKSTLLKILSRITEPTGGRIEIRGRIASLLEVGTGFHPELTGRENIYLNGAILGMKRAEIRAKFDEIVAFAEVEKFLDTPVKRYSSGMYVRLAFAVAAHLEPDILLVDEVLAVGDAEFQKKCLGKMRDVAGAGRTVLFVSHNMSAVEGLCPRSLYLVSGELAQDGETDGVVAAYVDRGRTAGRRGEAQALLAQDGLVLEDIKVSPGAIRTGEAVAFEFRFRAPMPGRIRECAALIYTAKGFRAAIVDVRESGSLPFDFQEGRFAIRAQITSFPLIEDSYAIGLFLAAGAFSGDLFNLETLEVGPRRMSRDFVPYAAQSLGIVSLETKSSIRRIEPDDFHSGGMETAALHPAKLNSHRDNE